MTPIKISLFAERQYDEDNFLGQIEIPLDTILEKPNQWAINKVFPLEQAEEYEKEVAGKIGVQAKWVEESFEETS